MTSLYVLAKQFSANNANTFVCPKSPTSTLTLASHEQAFSLTLAAVIDEIHRHEMFILA